MTAPRTRTGSGGPSVAVPVAPSLDSPRALLGNTEVTQRVPVAPQIAAGQAFMDLLLLGALACQAPAAVLSVPQADGSWSTLSYGLDSKDGQNDGRLFNTLASRDEPFEIVDLVTQMPESPLVRPPHSMRWAYGLALRTDSRSLLGVVAVLDHWVRQLTKREQRAMVSLSRQMAGHLAGLRRPAPVGLNRPEVAGVGPRLAALRSANGVGSPLVPVSGIPGGGHAAPPVTALAAAGAGDPHHLLRSHEVAVMFDVTERTVINWAAAGKLPSLRTMGGHLRFKRDDVLRLLNGAGG